MLFLIVISAFLLDRPVYANGAAAINGSMVKVVNCTEKVIIQDVADIYLGFENLCETNSIFIKTENKSSILRISTVKSISDTETPHQGTTNILFDSRGFNKDDKAVNIVTLEQIINSQGQTSVVPLNMWNIKNVDEKDAWKNISYLSRTNEVEIKIQASGDWSDDEILFFVKEMKYNETELNFSNHSGEIASPTTFDGQYHPNTITLYRILEVPSSDKIHILLTLDWFDVDTAMGEFILIGAGKEPFQGPKPLFISQPDNGSTYYVYNSSAYVLFVARSTQTKRLGFYLRWEHTGILIPEKEEYLDDPKDALKSRDICFFYISPEECNKSIDADGLFYGFRRNFSEVVRKYAEAQKISYMENFKRLNASSVVLHGLEKCKNHPLNAIVQIKDQGRSLLTWNQLGEVIDIFQKQYPQSQVGHCPNIFASDNQGRNFIIYLSVPVFALFLIFVWAWKQKVFEQSCSEEKEENHLLFQPPEVTLEPNLYGDQTLPKIIETSEQGRRRTLVAVNSAPADVERNSFRRTENDILAIPSTSNEASSFHLNLTKTKHRPSIQPLIDQENQLKLSQKIQKNENEHVYDSVSSHSSIKETKL